MPQSLFIKRFLFYLSSLISNFLVVNSYHEAKLKKQIPGRKKKIKVIWNGFNVDEISFGRNISNLSEGIKQILVVGSKFMQKMD